MARDPKNLVRLRRLCAWLASEHQISADAVHEQDAGGRWHWWLRWHDGPRDLPSTSSKSEELGIDTRHLYQARIITPDALAVQAARIALAGVPADTDVTRLARQIRAAAEGTDWPERPASPQEAAAAGQLSGLLRNAQGTDPALALAASVLRGETAAASREHIEERPPAVDIISAAGSADGGVLDQLTRIRAQAERAELKLIRQARTQGATWQQIATALGMSGRTSAQKRHADLSRRCQDQASRPRPPRPL